jgi:hypothetical protein
MILSKKDKEDLVIKLLYEGLPFKEIAKRVHISLSDISKIKRKITGEQEETEKNQKPLSVSSQAFKLFKDDKSLIDVSIILDVPKDEIIHFFMDYLDLQNMHKVVKILKEYKNDHPAFVKLFEFIHKNNTKSKDIGYAIKNINNINYLKQQRETLKKEIQSLLDERDYLLDSIGEIKNTSY